MATRAKAGPGRARQKGRSASGRVTQSARSTGGERYTPPIPKSVRASPRWMGIAIIALFALGALIVIFNYAGLFPGGVNNLWLVAAVASIFAGLIVATRYH